MMFYDSDEYFGKQLAVYQRQVDREAALDYKLDELREEATLTAEEICEHIASLTDEQFMQVCEALSEVANGNNNVAALRYMLRLICGDVINQKAQKAIDEMVKGND